MTASDPLDKIKKLLRLAKSNFRAEAELAMQRAMEIAARYRISLDTIDLDADMRAILQQAYRSGWRLMHDQRLAIHTVERFFNVTVIVDRPSILFIGTASDIAIAQHVFDFLVCSHRRCRRDFKSTHRRRRISQRAARGFTMGFFYGISSNLAQTVAAIEAHNPGYGVILASDHSRRDAFVKSTMDIVVRLHAKRPASTSAIMQGYHRGREIQIRAAIPNALRPQLSAAASTSEARP